MARTGHCFWLPSAEISTTVLGGIGRNLGALARPKEPLGKGVMPRVYLHSAVEARVATERGERSTAVLGKAQNVEPINPARRRTFLETEANATKS